MARTKGGKNRVTTSTDFDAQIAKLQKDKAMLEEGLSKTVAQIELPRLLRKSRPKQC